MFFLMLSPFFIALNIYYIYEICKWLTAVGKALCLIRHSRPVLLIIRIIKVAYGILWGLATASIYIAFLIPDTVSGSSNPFLFGMKRTFKLIGNYHLGVFMYMGMALMVVLILRLAEIIICRCHGKPLTKNSSIFHIRRSVLGIVYVSFVIIITLLGVNKAKDIKVNSYDVTVHKEVQGKKDIKIVMVADLHLGYNIGCDQMERMVTLINEQNPDVVVVAGDIFDNEYEALDDPEKLSGILSSVNSSNGVYAVYGNHDVNERIIGGFTFNWDDPDKGSSDEMDAFLEKCGFTLLCDDFALIDDSFYLYGRPDYEKPGKWVKERKTPYEIADSLEMNKPVIVIDHEPRELKELSDAGMDLDLCGHTHDGQFFPMNLISRYFTWENSSGLLEKGNMTNIVSSGVGLYGPNIRIGTQAEICSIEVHFE